MASFARRRSRFRYIIATHVGARWAESGDSDNIPYPDQNSSRLVVRPLFRFASGRPARNRAAENVRFARSLRNQTFFFAFAKPWLDMGGPRRRLGWQAVIPFKPGRPFQFPTGTPATICDEKRGLAVLKRRGLKCGFHPNRAHSRMTT